MTQYNLLDFKNHDERHEDRTAGGKARARVPERSSKPTSNLAQSSTAGISTTRWTDEQWEEKYRETTKEDPGDLVRRAEERMSDKISILVDLIQNGDPFDHRRRKDRGEERRYRLEPGNWYLLYQLALAMQHLESQGGRNGD